MAALYDELEARLASAFAAVAAGLPDAAEPAAPAVPVDPVLRPSQRADFQADGALAWASRVRRNPRELANEVVARLEIADLCSGVEVAGPGYINLTVRDDAAGRLATAMGADTRLGAARTRSPERVVVDYSGPNAAKEMHVGHLRSTIIGDSTVRLLEWLGHTVIRQNHIGEWGTPFGMLVEHLLDIGEAEAAHELSTGDLGRFYRAARQKFDGDEAFKARSRQRVVLLRNALDAAEATPDPLVRLNAQYVRWILDHPAAPVTAAGWRRWLAADERR